MKTIDVVTKQPESLFMYIHKRLPFDSFVPQRKQPLNTGEWAYLVNRDTPWGMATVMVKVHEADIDLQQSIDDLVIEWKVAGNPDTGSMRYYLKRTMGI